MNKAKETTPCYRTRRKRRESKPRVGEQRGQQAEFAERYDFAVESTVLMKSAMVLRTFSSPIAVLIMA